VAVPEGTADALSATAPHARRTAEGDGGMAAWRRFTLRHRTDGKTRLLHHRGREKLAHARADPRISGTHHRGGFRSASHRAGFAHNLRRTAGPRRRAGRSHRSAQGEIPQCARHQNLHLRIQNPAGRRLHIVAHRRHPRQHPRVPPPQPAGKHPKRPPARGDPRETRLLLQPQRRCRWIRRAGGLRLYHQRKHRQTGRPRNPAQHHARRSRQTRHRRCH